MMIKTWKREEKDIFLTTKIETLQWIWWTHEARAWKKSIRRLK
jgi:hypothetical protein